MAYRPHPRYAKTNRRAPQAWGTSDRSGFITNQAKLEWQFDWAGQKLFNKRILVHPRELDKPQQQFRNLVLPPDPRPIMNARPEPYSIDEQGPTQSQLSSTAVTGATVLVVDSLSGFAPGQAIAVYLDNGTFYQGLISSISIAASSMTVSGALESQATAGNIITVLAPSPAITSDAGGLLTTDDGQPLIFG